MLLFASAAVLLLSIYSLPSTQSEFHVGLNPLASRERTVVFFENGSAALPLNFIRESCGLRAVECVRGAGRRSRPGIAAGAAGSGSGGTRPAAVRAPLKQGRGLFENTYIASRRTIVSYIERQDGEKAGRTRGGGRIYSE